jgi:hypothetical protein
MKVLALERELPNKGTDECTPHLHAEAAKAWELYQAGLLREMYFRTDWPGAVLVLECKDIEEANNVLATLPLVREGLIAFDVIPLRPYSGFSRLFNKGT